MSFHALQSSSQLTIRGALCPVETTQKRAVGNAVRSQKHTLGGQQLAIKSTTSKMVSRSTGLEVMAIEKPVLPYDVGSQGGVGILNPTKLPSAVKVKTKVRSVGVAPDTVLIQNIDDELTRFEIEYKAGKGSTVNTYLIKGKKSWGDSAYTLIDLPEDPWVDAFVPELKKQLKGKPLGNIVLGHYTPRMTMTLAAVLNAQPKGAPPLQILCSNPTLQLIASKLRKGSPVFSRELLDVWEGDGVKARLVRAKTGDTLVINEERELKFQLSNTPRWPDAMMTYDTANKLLFSSKLFGAHTMKTQTGIDTAGTAKFEEDWNLYFENLIAPCAERAGLVLNRAAIVPVKQSKTSGSWLMASPFGAPKGTDDGKATFQSRVRQIIFGPEFEREAETEEAVGCAVATIAPRHGPVIKDNVKLVVDMYKERLDKLLIKKSELSVAVIYASAYGNTGIMADAVSFGLRDQGMDVRLVDCEFMKASEVAALVKECQGFAIGSPTLGGHVPTPVVEAISAILKDIDRDLPYGVFGSYGWSGEAVGAMQNRLKDAGFKSAFNPISLKFKPTDDMIEVCKKSGEDLANEVRRVVTTRKIEVRKDLADKRGALLLDDRTRATGRITTAMAAVTAKVNGVDSLMLCPWVSQASFNPPAVTVSLPKEASPAGTLLLNAKFTLSVLGTSSDEKMVKDLLNKGFRSGDDCFAGIEIGRVEETSIAFLAGAASYLKCTVVDRMDCGDHYVLLASIDDGKVLSEGANTMFHFRQSGQEY